MTASKRILEDPSVAPEVRAWLSDASALPPMPAALDASLAQFAAGLATGLAAGGAATAALVGTTKAAAHASVWAKWGHLLTSAKLATQLAIGATVGVSMAAAGYVVTGALITTPAPRTTTIVASAPPKPLERSGALGRAATDVDRPIVASEVASPKSVGAASAEVSPELENRAGGSAIRAGATADLGEQRGLAKETRMLSAARASLPGSPAQALEITNEYRALFPQGELQSEAEFIAIDALLRLGRRGEAEERARPWLSTDANHLYAKRLRQLLGTPPQ